MSSIENENNRESSSPRVSIIVPVYNREKLVIRSLDSIINQKEKPFEIIIVDNNSTDATYSTIEKWIKDNENHGVNLILLQEPKRGACEARRRGELNASGDFLLFFDSDDEMHPDLLQSALEKIEKNEEAQVVCWKCRINLLDNSKRVSPFIIDNPLEGHLLHSLFRTQGYMIRKDFMDKVGGWRKSVTVWNDYELGLRILLHNPKIVGIDKVLAEIYAQEKSITGVNFSSKEGLWEKTLDEMRTVSDSFPPVEREKVRKILDYRSIILAAHYKKEGNRLAALALKKNTLKNMSRKDRFLLTMAYLYTSKKYRGAWRLIRYFYYG